MNAKHIYSTNTTTCDEYGAARKRTNNCVCASARASSGSCGGATARACYRDCTDISISISISISAGN